MSGETERSQRRFERALRLLLELHVLIETHQGNSPEADAVRDALDPYFGWCADTERNRLTKEQKTTLELVSRDLRTDE